MIKTASMKIISDISKITNSDKGAVIAIGNFDGVHRGHQTLINRAKEIAKNKGAPAGVLTFEPHPRRLFQPDQAPGRLTQANLKADRLNEANIDILFSLGFDWDFASQTADEFIQNILIDGLNASHVIVGENFRFGQLRQGDAEMIKKAGIDVDVISPVVDETHERISSSRIRSAIRSGDIDTANNLLGWEWEIRGPIFRGDRRGHELGYPTANVLMKETLHPAYGVYATLVQIEGENEWLPAATNIGIRPMFEVEEGQVEAHILNFPDRDIYGKILRVKPVKRLRGEAKFNSLEELIAQIDKDCEETLSVLK